MQTRLVWAGATAMLLAGCGSTATTVGASSRSAPPVPVTVTTTLGASPSAAPSTGPHFATPQAAMTDLAAAYNAHDDVELGHVTNPSARAALQSMRSEAVDLRLVECSPNAGRGDHTCQFDHDFPAGYHPPTPNPEGTPPDGSKQGWAQFTVGPATASGWYMTVLESCD